LEHAVTEPWVSVGQIAEHLGVTRDSIHRWIDRKGFPRIASGSCGSSRRPKSMSGCALETQMKALIPTSKEIEG